jgi:AcrR family transcriptional regulator
MGRPKNDSNEKTATERMTEAFWEMLSKESYPNITVRGISSRAKVNHNTFYRHFENVDDMAKKAFEDIILTEIPAALLSGNGATMSAAQMLSDISAEQRLSIDKARLFATSGSSYLTGILRSALRETWLKEAGLRELDLTEGERIDLTIIFGGVVAALGELSFPSGLAVLSQMSDRPLGQGIRDTFLALGFRGHEFKKEKAPAANPECAT